MRTTKYAWPINWPSSRRTSELQPR